MECSINSKIIACGRTVRKKEMIGTIIALCKTKHSHHLKDQKMVAVLCFALRSLQAADSGILMIQ